MSTCLFVEASTQSVPLLQFTQPDDQPIVINTERIITAALWLLGVPIPIIILLALLHHN